MAGGGKKIIRLAPPLLGFAIGGLFICAGVLKALDPAQFAEDIANFRLLPHAATVALALYLPWLEIICGAALIIHKLYRGGLLIIATLCVVYLGALVSAQARKLNIHCGCFGHAYPDPLGVSLLLDSVLLASLALLLAVEFRKSRT